MWKEFFDEVSFNYCATRYCEIALLINAMNKQLQHIDQDVREKLYYLFDYNGGVIVSEQQFINVMMIWSVFSANDINNDNELDAHEVKQLFWLFDNKKPTKEKIDRETMIMDADGSGTIDRLEWMAYLCSTSTGTGSNGQKDYFDFELRADFEDADKDKDGEIHLAEFISFLKARCHKKLSFIDEPDRWQLDGNFKQAAMDMFELLTDQRYRNKTDAMTWIQMKNFKEKCSER